MKNDVLERLPKSEQPLGRRGRDRTPGRPQVLYVEDDDINWDVAEHALSKRYEVQRAKTSNEVFEILTRQRFRAILMDIELAASELNGIEITRILKRPNSATKQPAVRACDFNEIPAVIFVTAYQARYTREYLLRAGGSDVITKPVDLIALHLSIARCIAGELGVTRSTDDI